MVATGRPRAQPRGGHEVRPVPGVAGAARTPRKMRRGSPHTWREEQRGSPHTWRQEERGRRTRREEQRGRRTRREEAGKAHLVHFAAQRPIRRAMHPRGLSHVGLCVVLGRFTVARHPEPALHSASRETNSGTAE
jgi:hypothetical protein